MAAGVHNRMCIFNYLGRGLQFKHYRGGEYTFFFSREGSVYLNIRGEGSVIQASLRERECNLLLLYFILSC